MQHILDFTTLCNFQWRFRLLRGLRSVSEVAGSNTAGSVVISCQCCVFFSQRYLRRNDYSSGGVLPSMVYMRVILKSRRWGSLGQLGLSSHEKTKLFNKYCYLYSRIINTEPTTIRLLVRHIILHGAECWTLSPKNETMLNVSKRNILRRIHDPLRDRDHCRCAFSKECYDTFEEFGLSVVIRINMLGWAGHVVRTEGILCLGETCIRNLKY